MLILARDWVPFLPDRMPPRDERFRSPRFCPREEGMFQPRRFVTALAVALLASVLLAGTRTQQADAQRRPIESFDPSVKLTDVAFVENAGQWDEEALFMARARGANVWLTGNRILFDAIDREQDPASTDEEPLPRCARDCQRRVDCRALLLDSW
jgi:predicted exporter